MNDARELIAVLQELNRTADRNIGKFTASLVGMFGSNNMLDLFLKDLDAALANKCIPEPLKRRAVNLVHTFIPQVAGFNGVKELTTATVTAGELRTIRCDTPDHRTEGVRMILAAFLQVLNQAISST